MTNETNTPQWTVASVGRDRIIITDGSDAIPVSWGEMRIAASPGNYHTGAYRVANPESLLDAADREKLRLYRRLLADARNMADAQGLLREKCVGPDYETLGFRDPDQSISPEEREIQWEREDAMLRGEN